MRKVIKFKNDSNWYLFNGWFFFASFVLFTAISRKRKLCIFKSFLVNRIPVISSIFEWTHWNKRTITTFKRTLNRLQRTLLNGVTFKVYSFLWFSFECQIIENWNAWIAIFFKFWFNLIVSDLGPRMRPSTFYPPLSDSHLEKFMES